MTRVSHPLDLVRDRIGGRQDGGASNGTDESGTEYCTPATDQRRLWGSGGSPDAWRENQKHSCSNAPASSRAAWRRNLIRSSPAREQENCAIFAATGCRPSATQTTIPSR